MTSRDFWASMLRWLRPCWRGIQLLYKKTKTESSEKLIEKWPNCNWCSWRSSHLCRLLVSASQDGKLIIWDSYTTNKVSPASCELNDVMVVSSWSWFHFRLAHNIEAVLPSTWKYCSCCCIYNSSFAFECFVWYFCILKTIYRMQRLHAQFQLPRLCSCNSLIGNMDLQSRYAWTSCVRTVCVETFLITTTKYKVVYSILILLEFKILHWSEVGNYCRQRVM